VLIDVTEGLATIFTGNPRYNNVALTVSRQI
jgi:hypothetical protein